MYLSKLCQELFHVLLLDLLVFIQADIVRRGRQSSELDLWVGDDGHLEGT